MVVTSLVSIVQCMESAVDLHGQHLNGFITVVNIIIIGVGTWDWGDWGQSTFRLSSDLLISKDDKRRN